MTATTWALLLPVQAALLWFGQRRLFWLGQRILGIRLLALAVSMPGTVLHELSHFIAAVALGVPVGKVELFRPRRQVQNGQEALQLGVVQHAQTDWLRGKLIAVAPLILVPALFALADLVILGTADPAHILHTWLHASWPVRVGWPAVAFSCAAAAFPSPGDDIGPVSGALLIVIVGAVAWWGSGGNAPALVRDLGALSQLLAVPSAVCVLCLPLVQRQ